MPILVSLTGLYRTHLLVAPDGNSIYLTGKRLPACLYGQTLTLKGELYFIGNHARLRVISLS